MDNGGSLEILEENNYYPFGLRHKGYNGNINSTNIALKRKFGGKELQDELGLEWYDFEARNYDATLGRWMNIDPLSESFYSYSTYNAMMNDPINFIDPDGRGALWIPEVDPESGNISYKAERGDSANTFASQYGISKEKAEAITDSKGSAEIKEGTSISGEKVAAYNGNVPVLTLDLLSPEGKSEQRRFDQYLFASDVSKASGFDSFHPADFYTNRLETLAYESPWRGAGSLSGTAKMNVKGNLLEIDYSLEIYNSNRYAKRGAFEMSTFANYDKQTMGQRFPGDNATLNVNRVLSNGNRVRANIFIVRQSQSEQILTRLNRMFSVNKSKMKL